MKRVRPAPALLAYLDVELAGPPAKVRRLPRAALVAAAAALVVFVLVFAAVALAQEAPHAPHHHETAVTARARREARRAARAHEDRAAGDAGITAPPTAQRSAISTPSVTAAHGALPAHRHAARAQRAESASSPTPAIVVILGAALALGAGMILLHRRRYPLSVPQSDAPRPARVAGESRAAGRPINEDACRVMRVGAHDVLVVADGVGGLPGGARASTIAVGVVAAGLRRRLSTALPADLETVRSAIKSVFDEVVTSLDREARETGLDRVAGRALCTTLLVVVGTPTSWVVGGIGDGSILIHSVGGATVPAFVPQKSSAEPSVLDACLGPLMVGEPTFSVWPRASGDVALVMTDGVADRVELDALARCVALRLFVTSDARAVVREVLDDIDRRPETFDDNASLALAWSGP